MLTSAAQPDQSSDDPQLMLPVQVPCQNSDTPQELSIEGSKVVLRQRGRNTVELDPDDADTLGWALLTAAIQVRAAQPDATILSFERTPY